MGTMGMNTNGHSGNGHTATASTAGNPAGSIALVQGQELPTLYIHARLGTESCDLAIARRETVEAIEAHGGLATGLQAIIDVGTAVSLAAAARLHLDIGTKHLDDAVERATCAIESLRGAVTDLGNSDGPLARLEEQISTSVHDHVAQALAEHADPTMPGSLASRVAQVPGQVEAAVRAAIREWRVASQAEVQRQLDALTQTIRLVHEIGEGSPLAIRLAGIEQGVTDLRVSLATQKAAERAAKQERQRGPARGFDYEDLVVRAAGRIAALHGDCAEHVGTTPGLLVVRNRPSQVGDVVCRVDGGDSVRLVLEAKDRDRPNLSSKAMREELALAAQNRAAQAAIVVLATRDNAITNGACLTRLQDNQWAVVLDSEDPSTLPLEVAYSVARSFALACSRRGHVPSEEEVAAAVGELERRLTAVADVRTHLTSIANSQARAMASLGQLESSVREAAARVLRLVRGA